ncbi:TRAP transporter small permease [uncultured Desulfobacter sp.]|uniref:TRAP transporter small permease n=1 Tax=uncultured Desulfobacter sp. TaxID=240139 RepID=UPI0029F4743C|nr:TRAP transporter small permease [uncultured Desulfobacter sp.]
MQQIFKFIDRVENFTLVWTILILALIGFVQVITRYIFNFSFPWFEELGRYLGVFIAFLGAAIGVKTGSHFTMDLLILMLPLSIRWLVNLLSHLLSAGFFFIVAVYSWKIISRMYGYETTSPVMGIPMYIAYLPIPAFSVVIGTRFIIKGFGFIKEALGSLTSAESNAAGSGEVNQ